MTHKVGIIAYGTPEDRVKLEALARVYRTSGSRWLIDMIRERYDTLFAEQPSHGSSNQREPDADGHAVEP
jgi:hypothetical protein